MAVKIPLSLDVTPYNVVDCYQPAASVFKVESSVTWHLVGY
jgi:hypothetical protein